MASFARDLLGHKYFQDCSGGSKEVNEGLMCSIKQFCLPVMSLPSPTVVLFLPWQKMEELLIRTKREKPTFIPYFISACKDLPGKFILGYQPRGKPRWAELSLHLFPFVMMAYWTAISFCFFCFFYKKQICSQQPDSTIFGHRPSE